MKSMIKERIAIVGGFRTPMGKAGGVLKNVSAHDLAAKVVRELIIETGIDAKKIDEVIFGNVANLSDAANIARVIALKAGLDNKIPAFTVHRNCASGMEALTTAATRIWSCQSEVILIGGTESMSSIPLLFSKKMTNIFNDFFKAKNFKQKLLAISQFRPNFLSPVIGLQQGLTDPISGLIMGLTAELVAKEFKISREDQDKYSLLSNKRAEFATSQGIFKEEIIPIYNNDLKDGRIIDEDEGIRKGQTIDNLAKLKPYFEKDTGTVTVGNSSQITDGAAAMIVMTESKAKDLGLEVLGYLQDFSYEGLRPEVMGLGPVYATSKLFAKTGFSLKDIDLIELNEAFAAQVIGCERAFASDEFAKKNLDRSQSIGEIDRDILNVNGGAIALGHPVGMSGARIIIHLLRELRRRNKNRGLATLCIGGGQGGACILELS